MMNETPCLTNKSWRRLREIVERRDHYVCIYCGRFSPTGEVDHVLPLSRGGTDAVYNLAWACQACNRSKGDRTVCEWVRWLGEQTRNEVQQLIGRFLKLYGDVPDELLAPVLLRPDCKSIDDLIKALDGVGCGPYLGPIGGMLGVLIKMKDLAKVLGGCSAEVLVVRNAIENIGLLQGIFEHESPSSALREMAETRDQKPSLDNDLVSSLLQIAADVLESDTDNGNNDKGAPRNNGKCKPSQHPLLGLET